MIDENSNQILQYRQEIQEIQEMLADKDGWDSQESES